MPTTLVESEVLTVEIIERAIFWTVTPCNPVKLH
jgi:hypothetical protein